MNIRGKPFINNIYNNILKWKSYIKYSINDNSEEDSLKILCIQGLYGYRSGVLGKLFDYTGYHISQYTIPGFISSFFENIESNDFEIITLFISIITRILPFYNYITIDPKQMFVDVFGFINENESMSSMFDLNSLFLLKPLYDSGCAIYSNKKYKYCGFEKWTCKKSISNKGMTWCYFECLESFSGVTIINLDFKDDNTDFEDIECLKHIVDLKNKLENNYGTSLETYETYVVGNFNISFNVSNIIYEIGHKLKILENEGLKIVNNLGGITSTEFIFYNKYDSQDIVEHIDLTTSSLELDTMFYKINRISNKNTYSTINPLFINKLIDRLKEFKDKEEVEEDKEVVEEDKEVVEEDKEVIEEDKEVIEEDKVEEDKEVNDMSSKLQEIKIDGESLNIMEKISIHDDYFDDLIIHTHISPHDEWDIL